MQRLPDETTPEPGSMTTDGPGPEAGGPDTVGPDPEEPDTVGADTEEPDTVGPDTDVPDTDDETGPAQDTTAEVEHDLLSALAWWSAGSIAGGGALWAIGSRSDRPVLSAFGRQHLFWGAVDAVIAGVGLARRGGTPRSSTSLRRVLLVNAALDAGYMVGGAAMIASRNRLAGLPRYSAQQAVGDGAAIIIQGGYLMVSDLVHARRLEPEEHQP